MTEVTQMRPTTAYA